MRSPPTSPLAWGSVRTCGTPSTTSTSGMTGAARRSAGAAEMIPRPAQILHLVLAADLVRGFKRGRGRGGHGQPAGPAPTSIRTWPGPTSTWPAACGQTAMSRSRSPTCSPVPRGPRSTSYPATGAWPCARRWPTSPTSSPRGAVPTRTRSPAWPPVLPPASGSPEPSRSVCAGPGWSTTSARSPCRTACLSRQATTHDAASRRGRAAALAEPVRLHPYYAQRILSRVRPLADLAADVGAHHERLDGSGYPLGLAAPAISIGARVLAAADVWAERAGEGPPDLTGEGGLDPACVAALRSCPGPLPVPRASAPAPIRAAPPSAHASWRYCGCSPTARPTPTSARPCTQPAHHRASCRAHPHQTRSDQPRRRRGLRPDPRTAGLNRARRHAQLTGPPSARPAREPGQVAGGGQDAVGTAEHSGGGYAAGATGSGARLRPEYQRWKSSRKPEPPASRSLSPNLSRSRAQPKEHGHGTGPQRPDGLRDAPTTGLRAR